MGQGKKVAKAAGFIMLAMIVSRVLGYIRDIIIYAHYGQNRITDAYNAAFSIPDFLYMLLVGGALSSAFIPVFSSYIATGQEEDAWEVASVTFNVIMLLMALGILIGVTFSPQLIRLLVPGFDAQTMELTVFLTRIMFIQVIFMAFSGISMGILNSHKHFVAPAIGSVLYNLGIIVVGYLFSPRLGIAAFSIGVVVGAFLNFAAQVPMLLKIGLRYRWTLNLRHPGVKQLAGLILPVLIGLSITQFNLFVNQNLASGLPNGIVSALRSGQRLMQLPIGVFAIAIAVAVFPTLTEHAAKKELHSFKRSMSLGVRTVIFITLPASAGLIALAVPLIRLIFEQGKFTPEATQATAVALFFYSIGIFAYSAIHVLSRAFYALKDTTTPVTMGSLAMLLNLVLNLLLIKPMAHGGLAFAYSIAGIFNMLILLWILRKKIGSIDGRNMLLSFLKSLAASVVMGVTVYLFSQWLEEFLDVNSKINQGIEVMLGVGLGAAIYIGIAWLFRMEEARMVAELLARRFKRAGCTQNS
ncbi:murein biosynthesis integral membrane protein MurJ [Zhaonella formicivorans]|uniref:murein biosynthesis integral membrane protein MurJ n=1 Tax=Zhaonella formicivorans TaxID=2528593 RepID=UPI0010D4B4F3|nr:murein biosynthesis integral membrane protein MurJ [Zhaonella formicivorans]